MAANPERGEVELIAPAGTYTLALGINDICAMEARAKRKYGEMCLSLGMVDVTATREILYSALQRYHAKEFRNHTAVGDLIESLPDQLADALTAIRELVRANSRKDAEGNGHPPPDQS